MVIDIIVYVFYFYLFPLAAISYLFPGSPSVVPRCWPLIMVSTLSWDDEVVHKTYYFDLDLSLTFLQGHKNIEFSILYYVGGSLCGHHKSLNSLTLTFDHGFNS